MINSPLEQLVSVPVPAAALASAILLGHPRSDLLDRGRLLLIAHNHGGTQLLAEAMALRLTLIGLLFERDPTIVPPGSLTAMAMGEVLAAMPLHAENGTLQFDGDDLANRLRLASSDQGHA